jgi:predicted aspartyl protease
MIRAVLMLTVAAACAGCAHTARTNGSLPIADVALGQPLPVHLNGAGPFRFGIDTGQSMSLLVSPEIVTRLGLPVVQRIDASDGVNPMPVDVVRVDASRLGTLERNGQLGLVVPPTDRSFDGALGMPFFEGALVEFDYAVGRLRIRRGALPEPDGRTILPVRLDHGLPVVELSIAGRTAEALLDSGSGGGLLVPLSISSTLPLDAPPVKTGRMSTLTGQFDAWSARLRGTVRLGDVEIVDPMLTFSDYFEEINLGRAFLSDCRVTFDVKESRIKIERSR